MSTIRQSTLTVVFWRAVRLAAPIALISCGPTNLRVLTVAPNACAPTQLGTCSSGTVQVDTDLPPGTELARRDCDWVCLSVNCATEDKRCTVQDQPLTDARIVICESTGVQGCAVAGRPPAGLVLHLAPATSAGEFFVQMATYEAASVIAFEELAGFLERAAAPIELIERARRAAVEEARHARIASQLAGLPEVPRPRVEPRAVPLTLARLAKENFCDGCINEASSAVITASQAERASDPRVRELLAEVAVEELGHAELSWDLHSWLVPQLSDAERAAVRDAGLRKAREMLDPTSDGLDEAARIMTGLPGGAALRAQSRLLFDALWAPALDALA